MTIKELLEKRNAELAACQKSMNTLKQQLTDQGARELTILGAIGQLNEILKDREPEKKPEE